MSQTSQQGATYASTSKRPRDPSDHDQSPPLKRPKPDQSTATTPRESTVGYDACPTPNVADYFYGSLIPKAPELSQLFPTLFHDAYVVRRWLGSAGCAVYWRSMMDGISKTTDAPSSSHHLADLIAGSLARLPGHQRDVSSPKFRALCETIRSHLRDGKIVVFGESRWLDFFARC